MPVLGMVLAAGAGAASAARAPAIARGEVNDSVRAGYADTGMKYSAVTGNWTQPSDSNCSGARSFDLFGVGLGGFMSHSAVEAGSAIFCQNGSVSYFTWWQVSPRTSFQGVGTTLRPGDSISASVTRSGTRYTMNVTDATNPANSFSVSQTCTTCKSTTAEWVVERPTNPATGQPYPLSNFGTWTLTGATVIAGTHAGTIISFPDTELKMFTDKVLADSGMLTSRGSGFKVTWRASQ
jgi:hypothetical protein